MVLTYSIFNMEILLMAPPVPYRRLRRRKPSPRWTRLGLQSPPAASFVQLGFSSACIAPIHPPTHRPLTLSSEPIHRNEETRAKESLVSWGTEWNLLHFFFSAFSYPIVHPAEVELILPRHSRASFPGAWHAAFTSKYQIYNGHVLLSYLVIAEEVLWWLTFHSTRMYSPGINCMQLYRTNHSTHTFGTTEGGSVSFPPIRRAGRTVKLWGQIDLISCTVVLLHLCWRGVHGSMWYLTHPWAAQHSGQQGMGAMALYHSTLRDACVL